MKRIIYIFEDYRDGAPEDAKMIFTDRQEAENTYNSLIEAGNKVFNFSSVRVIFPPEKQGEKIITYGIYTNHHLPSLAQ